MASSHLRIRARRRGTLVLSWMTFASLLGVVEACGVGPSGVPTNGERDSSIGDSRRGDGSVAEDSHDATNDGSDAREFTVDDRPDGDLDASLPDVSFSYDAPIRDQELNSDSACAFTRARAALVPLDMIVMLDRSGSMINPGFDWDPNDEAGRTAQVNAADCNAFDLPQKDSKWCYAVNALATYFTSPLSAGNRVALQYFPFSAPPNPIDAPNLDGSDFNCLSAMANNLAVPAAPTSSAWATLPGNATGDARVLVASLDENRANWEPWGTPTSAAVHGIAGMALARHASSRAAGRTLIGILITDGDPNQCPPLDFSGGTEPSSVAQIRESLFAQTGAANGGVRTFVVGMTGANFPRLDELARGGGIDEHSNFCEEDASTCSYFSVGDGDGSRLVSVLRAIQDQSLRCSYAMPSGTINPNEVKVTFTPGSGPPQDFGRVVDASACGPADGGGTQGFFYDGLTDAGTPASIKLCPSACDVLLGDISGNAKLDILYGCPVN